ncbi:MAG: Urea ABC transporter, ATPase protein UrtD, partial [uncultured Acetobacteraceae bacterium]
DRARPLPRRRFGRLRRLPRAEQPVTHRRAGRAASRYRPQRRRQDHDDGRHHRQDPPHRRRGAVPRPRPHAAGRGRHRHPRHRPQVPEAHGVRRLDGVREPRTGAEGAPRPRGLPALGALRRGGPPHRSCAGRDRPCLPLAGPRRHPLARPAAMAGDRDAADAGPGTPAGGRARGRHDRPGDRAHRRPPPPHRRRAQRGGGGARPRIRPGAGPPRHRAARGQRAVGRQHRPRAERPARGRSVPGAL